MGAQPVGTVQAAKGGSAPRAGLRDMCVGAAWAVGGIVVTAITYARAASSSGGGHYFVAWGAILFGALQFFRGLVALVGSRQQRAPQISAAPLVRAAGQETPNGTR